MTGPITPSPTVIHSPFCTLQKSTNFKASSHLSKEWSQFRRHTQMQKAKSFFEHRYFVGQTDRVHKLFIFLADINECPPTPSFNPLGTYMSNQTEEEY